MAVFELCSRILMMIIIIISASKATLWFTVSYEFCTGSDKRHLGQMISFLYINRHSQKKTLLLLCMNNICSFQLIEILKINTFEPFPLQASLNIYKHLVFAIEFISSERFTLKSVYSLPKKFNHLCCPAVHNPVNCESKKSV